MILTLIYYFAIRCKSQILNNIAAINRTVDALYSSISTFGASSLDYRDQLSLNKCSADLLNGSASFDRAVEVLEENLSFF